MVVASEAQTPQEMASGTELRIEKPDDDDGDEEIQMYSNPAKYLFTVSKLTANLYLCGACALRADTFEKLGVRCVVNCTTREELPDPPLPDRVTTYLRIPVPDSTITDLAGYFHETADTIRKVALDGGNTLVHCVAGVSRSVSICLAYLIKYHDMSLRDAYRYIERRRPCINPNNSFFEQLIDFEIQTRAVPSISMISDNNTQSRIPDIYQCKFNDKLCCQLKKCQKRHCGTH